ncbi:hypothetical protein NDU88_007856 [Pleurodeles waltl]|uniref:Uncharacterized protein n=1 Tax=Pleurodeles waltl TaxID=8319 RepID=A0AAV7QLZ9_PLEWA|nr:hypothetical protein NDU88_007856 [Pleurodeles waltl]
MATVLCPDVYLELSKCSTCHHHRRLSGSRATAAAHCFGPAALLGLAMVSVSCLVGHGIEMRRAVFNFVKLRTLARTGEALRSPGPNGREPAGSALLSQRPRLHHRTDVFR